MVLVRLDYGGAPHRNPDGSEIGSPHLHRYREGYADKWAEPLPEVFSANCGNNQWLKDFMDYCNIVPPPHHPAKPLLMIKEVRMLLNSYYRWLRKQTALRKLKDWIEITTPYPDRHNDCLQIYVRRVNGGFELTDDGHIIEDLEQSGCNIDSIKRRSLLKTTLNGFGVRDDEKVLKVTASENNFALRKHNLLQEMLAVNDLFYLASPITTSLFREDVEAWLNSSSIRYEPRMELKGKSGYNHPFDFTIPNSGDWSERLLRVIDHPNRAAAEAMAFSSVDTKKSRPQGYRIYAIVNDESHSVSEAQLDAMREHEAHPVQWTKREQARQEFAA